MFYSDPNQDARGRLKNWWGRMPAFTRLILYFSAGVYLLVLFHLHIDHSLISTPHLTVKSTQLWRLFTFTYASTKILLFAIEMIAYLWLSCKTERKYGTVKYFIYFSLNSCLIGLSISLIFSIISYIPIYYLQRLSSYHIAGVWHMIIFETVISCSKDPDSNSQFLSIPIQIKSKYFPFVMTAALSWLGVLWELIFGLIFGYLYVYGFLNFTLISDELATRLESSALFIGIKKIPNFVEVAMAGEEELPIFKQSTQLAYSQINLQQTAPSAPSLVQISEQGYILGKDEQDQEKSFDKENIIQFQEESIKEKELI
ncbi:unnamed protein product [Blepharisma stoltei]|uniref:Uncharacterized protein n=1 Tax=Blepharisma stoltei TaxID=1481888 RepID=A0AAU9JWK1_9CILI|nr:unnamed protein product [Blepharisma stoltei]